MQAHGLLGRSEHFLPELFPGFNVRFFLPFVELPV